MKKVLWEIKFKLRLNLVNLELLRSE
jgi:hypothetical protein